MESNDDSEKSDLPAKPQPVFLLLLDGWGITEKNEANAIGTARTPSFLKFVKEYPAATLEASAVNVNTRYLILGSGLTADNETQEVKNDLTAIVSNAGLKQLKIFDSERLAALSSFFNGRREDKLIGEDWRSVSLENNKQEIDCFLGVKRIFKESTQAVKSEHYDFIVAACSALDFLAANGNFLETVKATEVLDKSIKALAAEVLDHKGILVITASGGNAEKMRDMATDLPDKNITNNPVPLIIVGHDFKGKTIGLKDAPDGDLSLLEPAGSLADVAPTILDLLNLSKTEDMSGNSLIV